MKFKNPLMFFLLFFFIILNAIDYITAQFILVGEANPIFLLTGNIHIVGLLKLGMILVLCFYYNRNIYYNYTFYYVTLLILILGNIALVFGIYSNITAYLHPELLHAASQLTNTQKNTEYFKFMSIIYIIPSLFMIVTFALYEWSTKYIKVDKEYFKKREWWKL